MAHAVVLVKETPINGATYPKGTELSVSDSIYATLKAEGAIAPTAEKKK